MKTKIHALVRSGCFLLIAVVCERPLVAGSFATLSPSGSPSVFSPLTLSGSTLYGTGSGGVYSLNTDGSGFQVLQSMLIGSDNVAAPGGPTPGLAIDGAKLYGSNGSNQVFALNTDGTGFQVLHTFPSQTGVSNVTLNGTTLFGTESDSQGGAVFSMNTDGSAFQILHTFAPNGSENLFPAYGVALSGSTLFGTAWGQIDNGDLGGSLYAVNTDGSGFHQLHTFTGTALAIPVGGLTLGGSTIFGTSNGPIFGGVDSSIFSISSDGGNFKLLHALSFSSFAGPTLSSPALLGTGVLEDNGPVKLFAMRTDGSGLNVLHTFDGIVDPQTLSNVTVSGSTIFGTVDGTVYSFTADQGGPGFLIPEPSSLALSIAGLLGLLAYARRKNRR